MTIFAAFEPAGHDPGARTEMTGTAAHRIRKKALAIAITSIPAWIAIGMQRRAEEERFSWQDRRISTEVLSKRTQGLLKELEKRKDLRAGPLNEVDQLPAAKESLLQQLPVRP